MYETQWRRLIGYLDTTFSSAAARGADEIVVVVEDGFGRARAVSIVMTPLEWDHYVSIPWGEFAAAAQSVARAISGTPPELPYLVYGNYELHPSATTTLGPESADGPGVAQAGDPAGGHWVAENSDGTVVARFEDLG